MTVARARALIIGVSATAGTCFAALTGLSISAMFFPARSFQLFSVVVAAVALCFGYLAFRAATSGKTDDETAVASLHRGVIVALLSLIVIGALLIMFGYQTRALLAHAVGRPASSFTNFRLLVAAVLLGFGAGFVVRMPKA